MVVLVGDSYFPTVLKKKLGRRWVCEAGGRERLTWKVLADVPCVKHSRRENLP